MSLIDADVGSPSSNAASDSPRCARRQLTRIAGLTRIGGIERQLTGAVAAARAVALHVTDVNPAAQGVGATN